MNKALVIVALALAGGLAFWLFFSPSVRDADPVNTNKYEVVEPEAPKPATPSVKPPSTPEVAAKPESPPKVAAADAGTDAAKDEGPFHVDLRKQEIFLRERDGSVMRVHVRLTAQTKATWKEMIGRRKEMVRMMYFLGSHRAGDAARAPGGGEHFRSDLEARFKNLVRTGPFELELLSFEVGQHTPKKAPDGGK